MIAVAQQAPPVPPVPPVPGQEIALSGSLDGWDAVLALLAAAVLVGILLWPLVKAIARRIEAGAAVAEGRSELMGLQERVRLLEESQPRVAELEERLDFAERLLAQVQTGARLPPERADR